jgi:hypothetical protein
MTEVERLRDEIFGLRMRIEEEGKAAQENHESLSRIIGERTQEIEHLQQAVRDFCTAAKVILPMVNPQHQTEWLRELIREHNK